MNLKDQLAIQALYKTSAPAKSAKVDKKRPTLGPINAVSQKEEAQDETETPAPVKRRGRPRKVKD